VKAVLLNRTLCTPLHPQKGPAKGPFTFWGRGVSGEWKS
jgi:hypothetical protein